MLVVVDGLGVAAFAPIKGVFVGGDTMPSGGKFDDGGGCGLGSVAAAAEDGAEAVLGLGHGVEVSLVSLVVITSICFGFLQNEMFAEFNKYCSEQSQNILYRFK